MTETFEKGADQPKPVRDRIAWPQRALTSIAPDESLARRAADGDERAFAAIFHRYHQRLFRYCAAIVGNAEDAGEALQNTMVKALRSLPGEERRIELKPWLYRVAHNESVDLVRRRRETRSLDAELPAVGSGLAEEAATRERLAWLVADLEELPGRQREALVMRELGGLGFEEIGAALGTSAAVARQTLYEARQSLRQMDEGREMDCAEVTRAISDGDRRVLRRRDLRAHLRNCSSCRDFRREIEQREGDFRSFAPLPAAAATGLLHGLLGGGGAGAGGSGGAAAAAGGGAAKALGSSAALKGAAAVLAIAAIGAAADRGGVIHLAGTGPASQPPAKARPHGSGPAAARPGANPSTRPGVARPVRTASRIGNARRHAGHPRAALPERRVIAGPDGAHPPSAQTAESPPAGGSHGKGHLASKPAAGAHGQGKALGHGDPGVHRHSKQAHPDKPTHPTKPLHPSHPEHPVKPAHPEHPVSLEGDAGPAAEKGSSHEGGNGGGKAEAAPPESSP